MTREQITIKVKNGRQSGIPASVNRLEEKYGEEFSSKLKAVTFDNGAEFLGWESIERSVIKEGQQAGTGIFCPSV